MQIKGIDYIGGVNYIDTIVKYHPPGYAAGFLCLARKKSGALGYPFDWKNGIKAAKKLAKTGKASHIRIHGLWHDDHKFYKQDIKTAVKQAKKVVKLACKYPHIQFYYSPWLENTADKDLIRKCRMKVQKVLGKRVKFVNSGDIQLKKGLHEVHHDPPVAKKYLFSLDGLSAYNTNPKAWLNDHKKAKIFFTWCWECNGKSSKSDPTPRTRRKRWLTASDIQKLVTGIA